MKMGMKERNNMRIYEEVKGDFVEKEGEEGEQQFEHFEDREELNYKVKF